MPRSTSAIAAVGALVLVAAVVTVAVRSGSDPQDDAPSAQVQTETPGTEAGTAEPADDPSTDAPTADATADPTGPDGDPTEDPTGTDTATGTDTGGAVTADGR